MTRSGDRLLRELALVAGQRVSVEELGEEVSRAVAPVVAHDGVRLDGTAPSAAEGTVPLGFQHGYEADFARAWAMRCVEGHDPLRWAVLARQQVPVGVIGAGVIGAGGGPVLDRSARRLFAEHGVGSELRLLLRDAHGVWGALSLLRVRGSRAFDADDVRRAADVGPALIAALRRYVTGGPLTSPGPAQPPAVVLVGPDDKVRAATPDARRWQPRGDGHRQKWVAEVFFAALAAQARRHARDPRTPAALVHGPAATFGRWVAFHAQPIGPEGSGDVAVVLQAASGTRLLPVFSDWYGLTARERQVVTELLDGAVPKQIARRLDVSVHTVNDHFKSIFRKTDADGRHELVTALSG
ncbi:helix-turn-helix transcriptional regulator [Actinosynnema sp. NPDC047251]|uniref:helix-turn-helix transcriptional regulator n=1 Tax=Saccharothrix espanaensis TaxID=103731 RepID=UPI001E387BC6|nr:helix-turn-helix transcriptional regulator [Saccharothrix espanaensis]